MKSLSALVLIDLQNDFLSEGGAFSKRHIEPQQICDAIKWLVQAARQQQRQVVWITSNYGEVTGTTAELQGKTHIGKPCCVKDTWGSEMVPTLQSAFSMKFISSNTGTMPLNRRNSTHGYNRTKLPN